MKTKTLKLNYIEFEDFKTASDPKKYPESGFYISSVLETKTSDLRMVNKYTGLNLLIMPEDQFDSIGKYVIVETEEPTVLETNEVIPSGTMSDNNFILEFSKILLNKK